MNKPLDKVCWGIIGAGDVCEVKSGPAFQLVKNSSLVAVMRRDPLKAKDFALRHKVKKWYSVAEDLINDPEVNAIYIATPPNSHKKYTVMAAEAGKPVYVEKPMALNYKECLEMVSTCKKLNVPLFVAYYRRALPNIIKIKELINAGAIGEVRYVNIRVIKPLRPDIVGASSDINNWRLLPDVSGGGYFYDLASHQLDALDFIFGPIELANGFSMNQSDVYPADDMTVGSFKFKSGILGQGVWSFNSCDLSDEEVTIIEGSKGRISFSFFGDHSLTMEVDGKEKQKFSFKISRHIQQPLIQLIVNTLLGFEDYDHTGSAGARTNKVMEVISNET